MFSDFDVHFHFPLKNIVQMVLEGSKQNHFKSFQKYTDNFKKKITEEKQKYFTETCFSL